MKAAKVAPCLCTAFTGFRPQPRVASVDRRESPDGTARHGDTADFAVFAQVKAAKPEGTIAPPSPASPPFSAAARRNRRPSPGAPGGTVHRLYRLPSSRPRHEAHSWRSRSHATSPLLGNWLLNYTYSISLASRNRSPARCSQGSPSIVTGRVHSLKSTKNLFQGAGSG